MENKSLLSSLILGDVVEAALPMNTSHDALRGQLRTALMQDHGVTDTYGSNSPYLQDVFPSHVVYQHQGQLKKRSYSVDPGKAGSAPKVSLGEPKDCHAAYMDSPQTEAALPEAAYWEGGPYPVFERYISQDTRDKADASDFAGKGKSFPILAPEDVGAALRSIGRAGAGNKSSEDLKASILAIAKRKGYPVPASDKKESVIITSAGADAVVRESIDFGELPVSESAGLPSTVPIKIIGPGWGSMAYYPKEVLMESGPKVFKAGTQMFWNHASESEQQDRPEGDLRNLAAILTEDAAYKENGPKGPGLYSTAKVFSDHAQQVKEKGPHIGVSIRAGITGREGSIEGRTGKIAESFTRALSVDFVTKAGAKGQPVLESQRGTPQKEVVMEKETQDALVQENDKLKKQLATLQESEDRTIARLTVAAVLKEAGIEFGEGLLQRACEHPVMKEGKADPEWVKAVVKDFTPAEGGRVHSNGDAPVNEAEVKKTETMLSEALADLGTPKAGLAVAVAGRA